MGTCPAGQVCLKENFEPWCRDGSNEGSHVFIEISELKIRGSI